MLSDFVVSFYGDHVEDCLAAVRQGLCWLSRIALCVMFVGISRQSSVHDVFAHVDGAF